jgi:hypothetical protein
VRALGYVPWHVRENEIERGFSIGQLHFLSADELVVAFVSHVIPETPPRRGQPDASSNLQLDALFVDPKMGQVQARREWPTFSERSRIIPASGGKFLVLTPDKLVLYSPAIEPLKELGLPVGREGIETDWDAVPSPGGKYLLISYGLRTEKDIWSARTRFELAETGNTQLARAWIDPGFGGVHAFAPFDDGDLLAINGSGGGLVIGPPQGPWRPAHVTWDPHCQPSEYRPINDRTILGWTSITIDRWCYSLSVMTPELLFAQEFAEKDFVRSVAVSSQGQRFALAIERGKGGSWALDIPAHYSLNRIMVYDVAKRRWMPSLDAKRQGIRSISALALSPDGSEVAVIDQDGILQVYDVTETG